MDYKQRYNAYLTYIENYMEEQCFCYDNEPQISLFQAMRYSLLAGGKRLRPILVFDFCRMCGGDWKQAVAYAAAVEMIHTYSLIHDDLPCMDNDDYRRGKLTNHKVYGEAMAILAGDALLTAAFSAIATANDSPISRIKAVEILAACSGELGMVGGQVLDIQSEQRQCTEQEVIDIQGRKTGALIRAACMLGVVSAGGSDAQLSAAADFAHHIGLAFQIRDDMLDVIGDAGELGKAVGVDSEKNTFVQLYGLDVCDQMIQTHTKSAMECLNSFSNTEFMTVLAGELAGRMH